MSKIDFDNFVFCGSQTVKVTDCAQVRVVENIEDIFVKFL
jgi:hypothetical protein